MWSSLYAAAAASVPTIVASPTIVLSAPLTTCLLSPSTSHGVPSLPHSSVGSQVNNLPTTKESAATGNVNRSEVRSSKRTFICAECKIDFKRADILGRHLRTHTGEKPFQCDRCNREFSRSDHLRSHRRTHSDEKPYTCTMCNYAAKRRDVLTRHTATRHKNKIERSQIEEIKSLVEDRSDEVVNKKSLEGYQKRTPESQREESENENDDSDDDDDIMEEL